VCFLVEGGLPSYRAPHFPDGLCFPVVKEIKTQSSVSFAKFSREILVKVTAAKSYLSVQLLDFICQNFLLQNLIQLVNFWF
jgi:hypothetical protein